MLNVKYFNSGGFRLAEGPIRGDAGVLSERREEVDGRKERVVESRMSAASVNWPKRASCPLDFFAKPAVAFPLHLTKPPLNREQKPSCRSQP